MSNLSEKEKEEREGESPNFSYHLLKKVGKILYYSSKAKSEENGAGKDR
jgi:hypothetical protein